MISLPYPKSGPVCLALLSVLLWLLENHRNRFPIERKIRHTAVNLALCSGKILIQFTLGFVIAETALRSQTSHFGLLYRFEMPDSLRWALAFLLMDLGGYWIHRLSHMIPFWWRFHRVHHTDLYVDVSTYFRNHPGEAVISWTWFVVIAAVLAPPLPVIAISTVLTVLSALFQHTDLRFPDGVERMLRIFWITGDLHKIHHSVRSEETDSNFGPLWGVWDRIFGTFRALPASVEIRYGLEEFQRAGWQTFQGALVTPFVKAPDVALARE